MIYDDMKNVISTATLNKEKVDNLQFLKLQCQARIVPKPLVYFKEVHIIIEA